ncbi:MAG: signal recognition particle protein [bacterium]|nr:signal recognition particle protein [bacterium]
MLDNLSNKLQGILGGLRSKGRLSERDIDVAMHEIRMALLEADVNFKVVKNFVSRTKDRCLASEILDSLTPGQNVVKVVLEELTALLGSDDSKFKLPDKMPVIVMLVGLQGSGKTTAAAKLAYYFKQRKHLPLLVACDVYRPAAADQLQSLGDEMGVSVFRGDGKDPVGIAKASLGYAKENLRDIIIIDTAGRLHVDERMMDEAAAIKAAVSPDQILMVIDAMTGQDATNVVTAFAEKVDFDGVIMSKMDGDARGGAALSVREVTGKPIKFISDGEKPSSLEEFHPDRMAKRILGMGDMVSIIERAKLVAEQEAEQEAIEAERIAKAELTFDDFITLNRQLHKMGGASKFISAIPGGEKALKSGQVQEDFFDRIEVIVNSMTKEERQKPSLLNGSRRARIARGAGVNVSDVNQAVARFNETRKMLKKMQGAAMQQQASKKPKKGKNRKKARKAAKGPMRGIPGMAGMSMKDLKQLQDMLGE